MTHGLFPSSQISTYAVGATVATATPISVVGKCLFQFDGTLQVMLERNSTVQTTFTLISAVGVTNPIEMDFGSFGRTLYVFFPAGPATLSMWTNTNSVN